MGYQALLFCPDEKAARGVTQVLSELDFTVEPCTEPFAAVKKLMAQHFDAIVVDCDNEQNATLLFKSARNSTSNQGSLAVAVVEGQAGVAKAFRIGANLVLTKPINIEQAKGTLRVARGLLRKGGDQPAPTATTPTAVSVAAPSSPAPTAPAPKPVSAPRPAPATIAPTPVTSKAWPGPTKNAAPVRTSPAAEDRRTEPGSAAAMDASPKTDGSSKIEAPAKPAAKPAPTVSQPAAAQKKYPWQASKPGAEPMASALKKAAEVAGVAGAHEIAPPPPSTEAAPALVRAATGSAAAPAPAKEKSPAPLAIPTAHVETEIAPKPAAPVEVPAVPQKSFADADVQPPSFSMGAPAVDDEEPANSKKALVIVAIVVILASLAGYLAWKNTSGKSSAAPASQLQVPAVTPASPSPAATSSVDNVAPSTTGPATSSAVSPVEPAPAAPSTKPSAKMIAKDSTTSLAPASTVAPQAAGPSAPALVVHNESSRSAVSKPSPSETEAAPAPSALGLTSSADPNSLAAISNAPVAVPKASTQVLKVSQGVSEGLVLKKVAPRYPSQALQMRMEGSVQLQATIGKDGNISNLKIMSGDGILAHAAQDAVKQWKYKPYYLNGEPVEIQTQITVNFKLPK